MLNDLPQTQDDLHPMHPTAISSPKSHSTLPPPALSLGSKKFCLTESEKDVLGPGFLCLFFFRAASTAYGDSQDKGRIGTVVAGLHHSHSNFRSKPHLQPTPQLGPLTHWTRPGLFLLSHKRNPPLTFLNALLFNCGICQSYLTSRLY